MTINRCGSGPPEPMRFAGRGRSDHNHQRRLLARVAGCVDDHRPVRRRQARGGRPTRWPRLGFTLGHVCHGGIGRARAVGDVGARLRHAPADGSCVASATSRTRGPSTESGSTCSRTQRLPWSRPGLMPRSLHFFAVPAVTFRRSPRASHHEACAHRPHCPAHLRQPTPFVA